MEKQLQRATVSKKSAPAAKTDAKKNDFVLPTGDDEDSDSDLEEGKPDPILEISMTWPLQNAKEAAAAVETWAKKLGDKKEGPNIKKIRDLLKERERLRNEEKVLKTLSSLVDGVELLPALE